MHSIVAAFVADVTSGCDGSRGLRAISRHFPSHSCPQPEGKTFVRHLRGIVMAALVASLLTATAGTAVASA